MNNYDATEVTILLLLQKNRHFCYMSLSKMDFSYTTIGIKNDI